jgi:ribosomal protein S18 acetylase RimI-like enzyme
MTTANNGDRIRYSYTADDISPEELEGFFVGWPKPPSPDTHLRLLKNSDEIVLAIDASTRAVVGFITALTDHVLSAYIPLLEVRTEYRHRGIGSQLVRRMIERLSSLYMIDLVCDPDLQPFYTSLGMQPITGMKIRSYQYQSGRKE